MSQSEPPNEATHPAPYNSSNRLVCCLLVTLGCAALGAFYAFVSIGVATVPKGRENEMLFAWIAGGALLGGVASSVAWPRPLSQAVLAAGLGGAASLLVTFVLAGLLFGAQNPGIANQPDTRAMATFYSGVCGAVAGAMFGSLAGLATCGFRGMVTKSK